MTHTHRLKLTLPYLSLNNRKPTAVKVKCLRCCLKRSRPLIQRNKTQFTGLNVILGEVNSSHADLFTKTSAALPSFLLLLRIFLLLRAAAAPPPGQEGRVLFCCSVMANKQNNLTRKEDAAGETHSVQMCFSS